MACPDENDLVGYVDELLPSVQLAEIARHLDACFSCRSAVAVVVAGRYSGEGTDGSAAPVRIDPPRDLLREYLRRAAPHREELMSRFFLALAAAGAVLNILVVRKLSPAFFRQAIIVHALFIVYELAILGVLRRGGFRSFLPRLNAVVEISWFFALQLVALRTIGPISIYVSPAAIVLGALIVFSAVRADPPLSMLVAIVASVWTLLLHELVPPPPESLLVSSPPVAMTVFFSLAAGAAAVVLAGLTVSRAEAALHEIREQDLFGKYILHEPLGTGGMGEVFRATYCPEGGFLRPVAIKRIRTNKTSDPRFHESFQREARLCAMLAHPNLVNVLDCGRFRGQFVIAMEFVDGTSLARLTKTGPLEPAAVAHVGVELAAALDYIHLRRDEKGAALGLVHCDLNPPNVLISRIGEVKLSDFGVARATAPLVAPSSTGFGGKVRYAAPEQLAGAVVDERTDLYALGLTLHEALTGEPAFSRQRDLYAMPPSLPSRVPTQLREVVEGLLQPDRSRRTASARAVRERLRDLAATLGDGEKLLAEAVERTLSSPEATLPEIAAGSAHATVAARPKPRA